jgi:hypothetical protein
MQQWLGVNLLSRQRQSMEDARRRERAGNAEAEERRFEKKDCLQRTIQWGLEQQCTEALS